MKLIDKKNDKIVFLAEIDERLANAIRRYLNRIPILAVDEVEISKNDSPLYDETIAHRVGLIPLKNKKAITNKTTAIIKLKANKEGIVYSKEFSGDAEIVYDNIPITAIQKGQGISIVATAKAGKGDEHAKFSPGLMFYRKVVEIQMDKKFKNDVKKVCQNNKIKEKAGKIIILDDQKKDICDFCESICENE